MKKTALILFFVLIAASSLYGQAGIKGFYVGPTVAFPQSPDAFKDYWGTGFGGFAGLGIYLGPFEATVFADYTSFPLDEDKLLEDSGASGGNLQTDGESINTIALSANLKFNLISVPLAPIQPYLLFGLGYYNISSEDARVRTGDLVLFEVERTEENNIEIHAGAGVTFKVSEGTSFFVDARYQQHFADGDNLGTFPIRAGLQFGGN